MKNTMLLLLAVMIAIYGCQNKADVSTEMSNPVHAIENSPSGAPGEEAPLPETAPSSLESGGSKEQEQSKEKSFSQKGTQDNTDEKSKKIIRDGHMVVEVSDIEKSKYKVDSILHHLKAYYENDQLVNSHYESRYDLKIRVASTDYDALMAALSKLGGEVKSKNVQARDVTSEYYDTESRMESAKKYLAQYDAILKSAKSIKDIIEIQEKIHQIQSEIDVYQGSLKYLGDQVRYGSLNLSITQKHEYYSADASDNIIIKLWNAFKRGGDLLLGLIIVVITIWPLWLLIGVLVILKKRIWPRWKDKNTMQVS